MDTFYDLFDTFFYTFYDNLAVPVLHWLSLALGLLLLPVSTFSPAAQIIFISFLGALLSRFLARRFKNKREKTLQAKFKKKLSALKYTDSVEDPKLKKVVRHGIHQDADKVYETIILDKFIEMGITYFLPLFFFLIWLEYGVFTPQQLKMLTGSPWAWQTSSGINFSAAFLYLYSYNIVLLALWGVGLAYRLARRRSGKNSQKDRGDPAA
jgi:hypothetical protein